MKMLRKIFNKMQIWNGILFWDFLSFQSEIPDSIIICVPGKCSEILLWIPFITKKLGVLREIWRGCSYSLSLSLSFSLSLSLSLSLSFTYHLHLLMPFSAFLSSLSSPFSLSFPFTPLSFLLSSPYLFLFLLSFTLSFTLSFLRPSPLQI